jgi:hypothetical protein
MPNLDLPQPGAANAVSAPSMRPTITPAKRSFEDLFTKGRRGLIAGLRTALGRPLARRSAPGRSRLLGWAGRKTGGDTGE